MVAFRGGATALRGDVLNNALPSIIQPSVCTLPVSIMSQPNEESTLITTHNCAQHHGNESIERAFISPPAIRLRRLADRNEFEKPTKVNILTKGVLP